MLTAEKIKRLAPQALPEYVAALMAALPEMKAAGITPGNRLNMFLATGLHECMYLTRIRESGNYSAPRLMAVWPKHFSAAKARECAGKPAQIFAYVYGPGTSLGKSLGNTETDDGWSFRGRGFFQCTGRYNYTELGAAIGADLAENPDLLADPKIAIRSAIHEWVKVGGNALANAGDFRALSNAINRGNAKARANPIGWADRQIALQRVRAVMAGGTDNGLSDAAVKAAQQALRSLGFTMVGRADGVAGPATRRALAAFQADRGLPLTGILDAATLASLHSDRTPIDLGQRRHEKAADLIAAGSRTVAVATATRNAGAGALTLLGLASGAGSTGIFDAAAEAGTRAETVKSTGQSIAGLFQWMAENPGMSLFGLSLLAIVILGQWLITRRVAAHNSGEHAGV